MTNLHFPVLPKLMSMFRVTNIIKPIQFIAIRSCSYFAVHHKAKKRGLFVSIFGYNLKRKVMGKITLTDEHVFEVVFKHPNEEKYKSLFYDVDDFMNKTLCDFHDDLDELYECQSAGCHNEDFNGCDCGSVYEDYEFFKLKISIK